MTHPACSRRSFLKAGSLLSLAGLSGPLFADDAPSAGDPVLNEKIEQYRQVALDILKPSKRDLEYGLALHRESLVFDAYGFAPRAALDGAALAAAIDAGASDVEVQDLREEMSMTRYVHDAAERAEFEQAWEAAGVTCIFQNAGEEGQDPLRLIKRLARFTYATDHLPDFMAKAATPDDIEAAWKEGRHCLYLTGNGVPLTQQWVSTHDELRYVRIFFQLGIRMMHVTYNRRNMLGDGCAEPANAGLSDFGRQAIREMNRVGVIVDVAHSGWQTSLEAAKVSEKPMVASHTTCAALHEHIRSKPDEVIEAIADTGGYVGMCCIPRFLGGSGDIGRFVEHIAYVVDRFGDDHVAIGTDVAYTSRNAGRENDKLPRRPKSRTRWAALWPPDPYKTTAAANQSLAWTNWPLFTVGLVQQGYSDERIRKILAGNVMRVARAALGES
ncbi:membrane dipeptidase [Maioricimonas sp. JC845]|uniref:dipeptidase n=1 Tax=Maioricimonas sp. JC845 TaxID=3232138 RepID=UPI003458D85A